MTDQREPLEREVRLKRLHPEELEVAMAAAPVAWVPLGALEFHAQHLPFGTDGFTAQALVEAAARQAGGVVLPWSALTIGTLRLDWSFRYEPELVEAALRQTIDQLAEHGARVVVVHTGHGPLDLAHLIKRVCAAVEASGQHGPDFRAYGLCYLELNAALGAGLDSEWPVAIDHGSVVETSWMMAIEPDLVHTERLPETDEPIVGVYGPHPQGRSSASLGNGQLEACAALLASRVTGLLAGDRIDPFADLRMFVERYWPEPLVLAGRAGPAGTAALAVSNLAPVSRYLTSLSLVIDGEPVAPDRLHLLNDTPGENNVVVEVTTLGPEAGLYIRRAQAATVRLPQAIAPGTHRVHLELGLAGVTSRAIDATIEFT